MRELDNHLSAVRSQYEALPYPAVHPEDERKRLTRTWLEDLPMINHYCFAGKQSFKKGFRALLAGGGTGDQTIFLAEQLKDTDARIVHLDLSEASIGIARERARIRGLTNIDWVHDSLLNLPRLDMGLFDYIGCSGVLHHLADPDAGFKALRSVLKPDGAIGLMVYGTTGRTGVYQMQALMRMVNGPQLDMQGELANTRDLLASLPSSNWFRRGEDLHGDHKAGDAGIYDLLLHSQDRSFSVGELFDWIEGSPQSGGNGMHLAFTDVQRGRSAYLPHFILGRNPPAMADTLRKMPRRQQYEIAELLSGSLITHSMYATPSASAAAPYGDAAYVPFFFHEPLSGQVMERVFAASRGQRFVMQHEHSGSWVSVNPGKYSPRILSLIDGKRSFAEIFDQFRADWHGQAAAPGNDVLFADFAEPYEILNSLDRLLLKHPQAEALS